MTRATLVIMTKSPRPGRVKARLATGIGSVPAAWWLRRQLARMARDLVSPRWTTALAVAPDSDLTSPLLPDLPRLSQGPGDLGDRMAHVLATAPRGLVLIIGSDIQGVSRTDIAAGFRLLSRHRRVIGPAPDGGFWAVGLDTRRPFPTDLFADARWSTEHALADTLRTLHDPAFLPERADVDTVADL
ncbi:TIGR04282 family arsenosugar biosynthesis glycosyltransferase [Maritimibacter dapengensis]|uniref:DUF2064 domain-containing protein n=1 Tax=Maritimibacter dapengensis TaxID=2836868 RepID=A0ABS6T403_9RHOB|nr:DUF2064 domain-containing protein [Maritimibacter dapengensis]MBV7379874.1 DUF2064 domain-containing protein [Maritimibacter dapengensis]